MPSEGGNEGIRLADGCLRTVLPCVLDMSRRSVGLESREDRRVPLAGCEGRFVLACSDPGWGPSLAAESMKGEPSAARLGEKLQKMTSAHVLAEGAGGMHGV